MSDSISACRDAEDRYIALCRKFGEDVLYNNGGADFTSAHAKELEGRVAAESRARAAAHKVPDDVQSVEVSTQAEFRTPPPVVKDSYRRLSDYKGPANSRDIFPYLVGETIKAAFKTPDGRIWIVVGSGEALVVGAADNASLSFWKENARSVKNVTDARRKEIEQKIAELRDLPGVELP
jgi:hypothetical protein